MEPLFLLSFALLISCGVNSKSFTGREDTDGLYNIGVGIGDVTGPPTELGTMGYFPSLPLIGIHTRLYARSFMVQSITSQERFVFVSLDLGLMDQNIKFEIVKILQEKHGDIFSADNIILSATHTHTGPSGFMQYRTFGFASAGFSPKNFKAITDGIVESIEMAYNGLTPGHVFMTKGDLENTNGNRAGGSYDKNPQEEREEYGLDNTVDKEMTVLRFETVDGSPIGCLNWFAVHPISVNGVGMMFVSPDNKGAASLFFEQEIEKGVRPGKGKFVAAFASANLGDASPSTNEYNCEEEVGAENCPENSLLDSNLRIVGRRQFQRALELFNDKDSSVMLTGRLQCAHQYINMTNVEVIVKDENGDDMTVHTCKPALGYSFAGFEYSEEMDALRDALWLDMKPSEEMVACQEPKKIFFAVGENFNPYDWSPAVVETQVFRIGDFYIAAIPGEFTTMSGRRLRKAMTAAIKAVDPESDPKIIVAGLSNDYAHYISTPEEYDNQGYEGGSTLHGKWTLNAYLDQYSKLVSLLIQDEPIPEGPPPPNLMDLQPPPSPIRPDVAPSDVAKYGDCIRQPYPIAVVGEAIFASFRAGNPKHDPMRGGTYFTFERENDNGRWDVVRTDGDFDTIFEWVRTTEEISEMRIKWVMPQDTEPGNYRIRQFGYYWTGGETEPMPYIGKSNTFVVRARTA